MEDFNPIENSVEKRKAEIEEFKNQREKLLENLSDEERIAYLINMYDENESKIASLDLNTISEDDIK